MLLCFIYVLFMYDTDKLMARRSDAWVRGEGNAGKKNKKQNEERTRSQVGRPRGAPSSSAM